ncbi:MAG: hypothetical protein ACI35W_02840 [Anaeroplasmataceae bacterium]
MQMIEKEYEDLKEKFTDVVIAYQNVLFESEQIEIKYNIEFGSLEIKKFKVSIEIVKLKKALNYIISLKNRGKTVDEEKLYSYLENEMKEYEMELDILLSKVEDAIKSSDVDDEDARKAKKLYYKIAKLIHPDLHPEFEFNDEIKRLWTLTQFYYNNSDFLELEKIYDAAVVMVNNSLIVKIPNISDKINEYKSRIEKIKTTKPYILEAYLKDSYTINSHKDELNEEIDSLKKYAFDLEKEVNSYLGENNYAQ